MTKLWETRKMKTTGASIHEIPYENGEEGTLNAYMCVQGRKRAKNWSQCVFLQNGWTPTVSLKNIPDSLILKIHNIVGICASKFFVVNIEHFSPITIFMNGKTLRLSCVSVYVENWLSLSYFNMGNLIHLYYGAYIAYSHIFSSCFSKNFYSFFSFGQL